MKTSLIRRCLSNFLAFSFVFTSSNLAFADRTGWDYDVSDESSEPVSKQTQKSSPAHPGVPYFSTCVGLFQAIKTKTIESLFLEQIDTPEQARQVLQDYNFILTKVFYRGLALALNKNGIVAKDGQKFLTLIDDDVLSRESLEELREFISRLRELVQNSEKLRQFSWQVAHEIVNISHNTARPAAKINENSNFETLSQVVREESRSQVEWQQRRNFIEALEQSSKKKIFENEMMKAVEQVLRVTVVELLKVWSRHRYKKVTSLTAWGHGLIGAMAMGSLSTWVWVNSEEAYWRFGTQYGIWGAGFTIGTSLAGAAIFAAALNKNKGLMHSVLNTFVAPAPQEAFTPETYRFAHEGRQAQAIWTLVDDTNFASRGALSIDEACDKNFCEMTPLQLAYVGHVEIIELNHLHNELLAAYKDDKGLVQHFEDLKRQAQNILDAPDSYAVQVGFMSNFLEILGRFQKSQNVLDSVKTHLTTRVDKIRETAHKLREKPYENIQSPSQQEIARGELLLARIETDLASLESMRVNFKMIDKKREALERAIAALHTIQERQPKSRDPEAWKALAQDILLVIDQVRALGLGVER